MKKDFTGAIAVMENYLDGAIADWENGLVDNPYLIISCIEAITTLNPIYHLDYDDVLEKIRGKLSHETC